MQHRCAARSQGNHQTRAVLDVLGALHERPDLPGVTISFVDGVGRRPRAADAVEFGEVQMAKLETGRLR